MSRSEAPGTQHPHELTLDNGLRVAYEPMPWLSTLSLELRLPLGAANDPEDAPGAAALLWEWLHRGAQGRSAREQREALDELGVRSGGGAGRASCGWGASLRVDVLEQALPLWAAPLLAPNLDEDELETARTRALDDLEALRDRPADRLTEALCAAFFAGGHGRSPYGRREALEQLDPGRLRAEREARLGPRGSVLAVAGGGDWPRVRAAVEAAFGAWRGGHRPLPAPALRPPGREDHAAPLTQTQLGVAVPALPADHPDWYAQALAWAALSGSMGARLEREVRERRGLAYDVSAGLRTLPRFGWGVLSAGTQAARAEETLRVLIHELERLRDGLEADELERARTLLVSQWSMEGESSGGRAAALARDLRLLGRPRPLGRVVDALEGVSLAHVDRALARQPQRPPTVVTLGPAPAAHGARTDRHVPATPATRSSHRRDA